MSISLLKLALNALGSPTSVAILGSVGAHALLGISLPALSVFSPSQRGPSEVPIVELTAEELARLPNLEPAPAIPFVPPAATQLLPLPNNFELPSVTQNPPPKASIPALPPKPSANSTGKASSLSVPQQIVTHRTGRRTPGRPSTNRAGKRSATSLEELLGGNRRRVAPGENTPFQVDPNKKPEDTLDESLEPKQTPINPHINDDIAQQFEDSTKTPADNTADGTESELAPPSPDGQPARPTPEGQTEDSPEARDRDPSETENEQTSTPADRKPEATSEESPREAEENEPSS
ncbi:MAG: hypothetical protein SVX43_04740, partial [Cyanobacteriota bacterium]|nr:hypothetical protein [Cyanobacteriota bacterium]